MTTINFHPFNHHSLEDDQHSQHITISIFNHYNVDVILCLTTILHALWLHPQRAHLQCKAHKLFLIPLWLMGLAWLVELEMHARYLMKCLRMVFWQTRWLFSDLNHRFLGWGAWMVGEDDGRKGNYNENWGLLKFWLVICVENDKNFVQVAQT